MSKPKLTKKQRAEIIAKYGKIPTKEEIIEKLMESQERLANALAGAWKAKPDDSETRKILIEVGEKAAKLRRSIKETFQKSKK